MEVLATDATSKLPLLVVRGEVKGQVGIGDEGFGAEAAAVRVQADAPVGPPAIRAAAAATYPTGWTFRRTVGFLGLLLFRSS